MFTSAQVDLSCDDVEACAEFNRRLGCAERFRTPAEGTPTHGWVHDPAGHLLKLVQKL